MRSLRLLTIVGVVLAVVFAVGSPQSIRAQTCQPRPRVGVVTTTLASGRLQVAVTAGMSAIQSIEFEAGRAVSIEVDGQAHRTPYVDRPAPGMTQRSFTVVRDGGAGTPTHLPFTVTDGCGPWKTFVGGGPQTWESAVRGRVTSAHDNQPVEGATVQIQGTSLAATTGGDGRFSISGVPRGSQTLTATGTGFQRATLAVTVAAGAPELMITLQRAIPPSLGLQSPSDGSTNVSVRTNVSMGFSVAMDPISISASTVTLVKQGQSEPVAVNIQFAPSRSVTLDPYGDLLPNTVYVVTVKGGAGGVKDIDGTPLAADVSWRFATAANTEPPSVGVAPGQGGQPKVGAPLEVAWAGITSPKPGDWLALFPEGAPDSSPAVRRSLGGLGEGRVSLTAPPDAGAYQLRLFVEGTNERIAVSERVWVGKLYVTAPALRELRSAGIVYEGIGIQLDRFMQFWMDITKVEGSPAPAERRGLQSVPNGWQPFEANTGPGVWEVALRWGYVSGTTFDVVRIFVPSLTASSTTARPGEIVSVCWSFVDSPTMGDWFALYGPPWSDDASYAAGTRHSTDGAKSGCKQVTVPLAAGRYEPRLFLNGYVPRPGQNQPIAIASPITVASPSP